MNGTLTLTSCRQICLAPVAPLHQDVQVQIIVTVKQKYIMLLNLISCYIRRNCTFKHVTICYMFFKLYILTMLQFLK